jgi:TonB family protein
VHEERFDLLVEEPYREVARGVPYSVVFSIAVHAALIFWLATHVSRVAPEAVSAPIVHYVELMRQNPVERTFTEAPGAKIKNAPRPDAAFSDANRHAASEQRTGDQLTMRPGDGSKIFQQPTAAEPRGDAHQRARAQQAAQEAFQQPQQQQPNDVQQQPMTSNQSSPTIFRQSAGAAVDLRGAIREIGKMAAPSGGEGVDPSRASGGEKGYTADAGPLSFETQWFDWGDYAQSMVSRIKVNWYSIMPDLIRTGVKGAVTIRFTIQRDGHISEIEILKSSGIPPYDFAAKHALELASPLKPLPTDFPKNSERVTALFYYNMEIPNG